MVGVVACVRVTSGEDLAKAEKARGPRGAVRLRSFKFNAGAENISPAPPTGGR